MGAIFSQSYKFMQQEKKTWTQDIVNFDHDVRKANIAILEQIQDGCSLSLAYTKSSFGGIQYQHWFIVADKRYFIDFGAAS